MNGHAVETVDHLTEIGVESVEAIAHDVPEIKDLDASKLTITRTTKPGKVPELDSKEVWAMKTCTDHSVFLPSFPPCGQRTDIIFSGNGDLDTRSWSKCLFYL